MVSLEVFSEELFGVRDQRFGSDYVRHRVNSSSSSLAARYSISSRLGAKV